MASGHCIIYSIVLGCTGSSGMKVGWAEEFQWEGSRADYGPAVRGKGRESWGSKPGLPQIGMNSPDSHQAAQVWPTHKGSTSYGPSVGLGFLLPRKWWPSHCWVAPLRASIPLNTTTGNLGGAQRWIWAGSSLVDRMIFFFLPSLPGGQLEGGQVCGPG